MLFGCSISASSDRLSTLKLIWVHEINLRKPIEKFFWQTFQSREFFSRLLYLEIINQSIPTGFIFVKILLLTDSSFVFAIAPASYQTCTLTITQLCSSHLSTSAGLWFSTSSIHVHFFLCVLRISWFVILIHFYCANESKDIVVVVQSRKRWRRRRKSRKKTKRNRFEATMVHSLASVGTISKSRQLRGNKSGLKEGRTQRKKNTHTNRRNKTRHK